MGSLLHGVFFNLPTLFLKAPCLKIINFLSGYYFFFFGIVFFKTSPFVFRFRLCHGPCGKEQEPRQSAELNRLHPFAFSFSVFVRQNPKAAASPTLPLNNVNFGRQGSSYSVLYFLLLIYFCIPLSPPISFRIKPLQLKGSLFPALPCRTKFHLNPIAYKMKICTSS